MNMTLEKVIQMLGVRNVFNANFEDSLGNKINIKENLDEYLDKRVIEIYFGDNKTIISLDIF